MFSDKHPNAKASANAVTMLLTRLHFYIGLFIGPFIFFAALTGTLYISTPQLESFVYRDALTTSKQGATQSLSRQIQAAKSYIGEDLELHSVRPAPDQGSTTRIIFKDPEVNFAKTRAVFVDPYSLSINGDLPVYGSSGVLPIRTKIDQLHREIMLGEFGRVYSELAASWLWFTALIGLYLWTKGGKRNQSSIAKRVDHLRIRRRHAQTGIVIAIGLLFVSTTGLTWSKWAGGNINKLRAELNWVTPSVNLSLKPEDADAPPDEHALHNMTAMSSEHKMPGIIELFDPILTLARESGIDSNHVEITPARNMDSAWVVSEIDHSWPTQVDTLAINPHSMQVTSRADFADFPLVAKLIRWGVDGHIGLLFGVPNQLILIAFGTSLCFMIIWGYRMWWLKRPPAGATPRTVLQAWVKLGFSSKIVLLMVALVLGYSLPLMGVTLVIFVLVDLLRSRLANLRRIQI